MVNHFFRIQKRYLLLEKSGNKSVDLRSASIIEVKDERGKDISFYCSLKKGPSINYENIEIPFMNGTNMVNSRYSWDNLEFTIYREGESEKSMKFLSNWIRGTFDNAFGMTNYAYTYKKDMTIYLYDNFGIVKEKWVLHGAFLTSISYNNLDYPDNYREYIEFPGELDCVLSFDRAILMA